MRFQSFQISRRQCDQSEGNDHKRGRQPIMIGPTSTDSAGSLL